MCPIGRRVPGLERLDGLRWTGLPALWTTLARWRPVRFVPSMSVTLRVRLSCLLACGVSVAMMLAGCGGSSSAPKTLPTLPSATDPAPASASPTPTATSKKAELAAAKAVVTQYYALLNADTTVANAHNLSRLMTANCTCRSVVTSTIRAARRHERFYGKNHLQTAAPKLNGGVIDVLVVYSYTAGGLEDASGKHISHAPGRRDARFDFRLVRAATPKIAEIVTLDKGHAE
jgi:hypothetical protein